MQLYYIVLLVVATLITIVDASSMETKLATSTVPSSLQSLSATPNDGVNIKRLRTDTEEGEKYEERSITVPGLSTLKESVLKIKDWFVNFVLKIKTSFTQRRQIKQWMKEEKTPDEVFVMLGLDKGLDNILAKPELRTWSVFMTTYNRKNTKKMVTMLGTLTKHYGDLRVAKMIESSRKDSYTKSLANRLQNHQLRGWRMNGLSTDVVFQLLRISEGGIKNLLSNKALNVWYYYFKWGNIYNNDWEIAVIRKLTTVYDDIQLSKASETAKHVESTEFMGKILQTYQFKKWLADDVYPAVILKKLEMDQTKWKPSTNEDIYSAYKKFYHANDHLHR
ncbi:RxLR effector protein [Phytophthora megakarya]|uniref:RxLR effector protein n=1 Tax=Phytophthora megakarya TaxID=4795 RepID=A0A225V0P8_9STRA|nr:RxLR effector protein [Phytophthora megakarya]